MGDVTHSSIVSPTHTTRLHKGHTTSCLTSLIIQLSLISWTLLSLNIKTRFICIVAVSTSHCSLPMLHIICMMSSLPRGSSDLGRAVNHSDELLCSSCLKNRAINLSHKYQILNNKSRLSDFKADPNPPLSPNISGG